MLGKLFNHSKDIFKNVCEYLCDKDYRSLMTTCKILFINRSLKPLRDRYHINTCFKTKYRINHITLNNKSIDKHKNININDIMMNIISFEINSYDYPEFRNIIPSNIKKMILIVHDKNITIPMFVRKITIIFKEKVHGVNYKDQLKKSSIVIIRLLGNFTLSTGSSFADSTEFIEHDSNYEESVIPILPPNLKTLVLGENYVGKFELLPNSLETITCYANLLHINAFPGKFINKDNKLYLLNNDKHIAINVKFTDTISILRYYALLKN